MFPLNGNIFPFRRKRETPKAQELMKHSRLRKLKIQDSGSIQGSGISGNIQDSGSSRYKTQKV